jgi:hypothetical protein
MNKQDFYKELKNIGVDISDKTQMKIWSLALLAMGQDYLDHKFDRCKGCYYEESGMDEKKEFHIELCKNKLCPIKEMPNTPGEVVDYLFYTNIPLDMKVFYNKYVDPILTELIKHEEQRENARQRNSGNQ